MQLDSLRPASPTQETPEKETPQIQFGLVERDGCAPHNAYLSTNRIEFFFHNGEWQLPAQPRMDGVVRQVGNGLEVVEINKLLVGDRVVLGSTEDGSEGIYLTSLPQEGKTSEQFSFMGSNVSRERRVDYREIASVLEHARQNHGNVIWVLGPAIVHSGATEELEWLIRNGYVNTLFGGNAVAVHDMEFSIRGTSLGVDHHSRSVHNGHRHHLEVINMIREAGSIKAAVESGLLDRGIMYECVMNNIPFVLAGSIRDDGPLPDTITDNIVAQDIMRKYTKTASAIVMVATALHSIATGNLTPTYRVDGNEISPIPIVCVDSDEFTAMKLSDRGTDQVFPVIANARDFLALLVAQLKKQPGNT